MQDIDGTQGHVIQDCHVREEVELLEHHAEVGTHRSELLAFLGKRLAFDQDLA
jgi:hypothetical protein